jgi:CysZ protein
MAMLLIPVIGIILVLPVAVTAASKTTLKLLKEQQTQMPRQQQASAPKLES